MLVLVRSLGNLLRGRMRDLTPVVMTLQYETIYRKYWFCIKIVTIFEFYLTIQSRLTVSMPHAGSFPSTLVDTVHTLALSTFLL